jgi:hypothetical protein
MTRDYDPMNRDQPYDTDADQRIREAEEMLRGDVGYQRMAAQAQGKYAPADRTPSRPYPRKRRVLPFLVGVGVAFVLVLGCVFGAIYTIGQAAEETGRELDAVTASAMPGGNVEPGLYKIESCTQSEFGLVDIKGSITNTEDASRSFWVNVQFMDDKGNSIGNATVMANELAPGQTYTGTDSGFVGQEAKLAKCQVTEITRF